MKGAKDEVSREGSLDGDLCGLQIADLADHDHVGILPHDRSESICKGEIDLRVDLNLANPFDLIFDRIFHGDDILVR